MCIWISCDVSVCASLDKLLHLAWNCVYVSPCSLEKESTRISTPFKKKNMSKCFEHHWMNRWQMTRMMWWFVTFFFKWKLLFGNYGSVTECCSIKGHLLNSFACIMPEFTGYEWMFTSVLSTNITAPSNNKTQLAASCFMAVRLQQSRCLLS